MAKASELYPIIKKMALSIFSPEKVTQVIFERQKDSYLTHCQDKYSPWGHFEYKTFIWISICFANMKKKEISQFVKHLLSRIMKT